MKRRLRIFINRLLMPLGYKIEPVSVNVWKVKMAGRLAQFQLFERLFEQIKKVEGDVVECGVGAGGTLFHLSYLVTTDDNHERMVWGYDSFSGFPEPTVEDTSRRMAKKGDWGDVSLKVVNLLFNNSDLPKSFIENRLKIVPGFFSDTLTSHPKRPIAFLHIDADLYQSYQDAFRNLLPFMSRGGVIVFDEYGTQKWPGATKAVDEFIGRYDKKLIEDKRSGKYYITW